MEKTIKTVEIQTAQNMKIDGQEEAARVTIQGVPEKADFIRFLQENNVIEQAYASILRQVEQQVKAHTLRQRTNAGYYDRRVDFLDVFIGILHKQGTGRFSHKKAAEILQEEVNKLNAELASLSAKMVTALTGGDVEQATQLGQQVTALTEDIKTKQEKIGEHLAAHAETAAKQAASRKANKK